MNIFVYGGYGQNNLGDEVFKISIQQIWPSYNFTFGNELCQNMNLKFDAIWIGGGSFLEQPIKNIDLIVIPIYFIGVGVPAMPSACNKRALERAKLIVCRDNKSFTNAPRDTAMLASDLVFARSDLSPLNLDKTNQITVMLNDFLTPVGNAVSEWRALSYYWFIQEISKILDRFVSQDYKIRLIPMCINPRIDDRRIAAAVQGRSSSPQYYEWVIDPLNEFELRQEISKSTFVITQRLHGLIYSIIEQTPCVTICTHEKFSTLVDELHIPSVDYYGLTDSKFRDVLNKIIEESTDFSNYIENARVSWDRVKGLM